MTGGNRNVYRTMGERPPGDLVRNLNRIIEMKFFALAKQHHIMRFFHGLTYG
jgi:hypothetical protein